MAQLDELVDVELVVGEQDEVLEVLGRGAGVVRQPLQRVVDARRGEQGQRLRVAGAGFVRAVGNAVVHRRQVGQVEQVVHQQAALGAHRAFEVLLVAQREVQRDRHRAGADLELHRVVAQQQAELLEVVALEQLGSRQRGLVGAGAADEAVAQARVGARHGGGVHAHEGVTRAHPLRQRLAGDEALQPLAQVRDAAAVDGLHLRQRLRGVVEVRGSDEDRADGHGLAALGDSVASLCGLRVSVGTAGKQPGGDAT